LKTDRLDMTADEIWRTYILLTRVEAAFRAMKSPLMERPIFHHLQHLGPNSYFSLRAGLSCSGHHRETVRGPGCVHTSWWTIRQQLSTHQVVTVVLPAANGNILRIRKAGTPEPIHREIYKTLKIPEQILRPVKTWHKRKT
jgi:hypothetical protein